VDVWLKYTLDVWWHMDNAYGWVVGGTSLMIWYRSIHY